MTNSGPTIPTSTKTALLDAAEMLFASHGINGTSLRAITQEAQANLASVNYHFGSKEGLVQAVFQRHLEPLNRRRLELLDEALLLPDRRQRLRGILFAFVSPVLRMRFDKKTGNPAFVQLMGRTFADSPAQPRPELLRQFEEVLSRFNQALTETIPELDKRLLDWQFHFTVGAMAYTVATGRPVSELVRREEIDPAPNVDRIIEILVDFLVSAWLGWEGETS